MSLPSYIIDNTSAGTRCMSNLQRSSVNSCKYIVVHYLGVDGENNVPEGKDDGDGEGTYALGAHFYIYKNGTIYMAARPEQVVYHCGHAGGWNAWWQTHNGITDNFNAIGIEMCVSLHGSGPNPDTDGLWELSTATQESCVKLVQALMQEYGVPISNVMRHYDVVGKTCPAPYVEGTASHGYGTNWTWEEFKSKLTDVAPGSPEVVPVAQQEIAYQPFTQEELYFDQYMTDVMDLWNKTPEELFQGCLEKGLICEPAYEIKNKDIRDYDTNWIQNEKCVAKPGALAIWGNKNPKDTSNPGFIGFVEKVKNDNKILISWSDKNCFFNTTWLDPYCYANGTAGYLNGKHDSDMTNRKLFSGYYFLGYIYPPDIIKINQNYYYFTTNLVKMDKITKRIWVE